MRQAKMTFPPFEATVEQIEGGARLLLKPENSADLDSLREHVERMVEGMGSLHCCMELT